MSQLTLHPVFDVSGLVYYALAERAGRKLADTQTYTLIDGKLFFAWPVGLDRIQRRTSKHRSCAHLLGFCHVVPTEVVELGAAAIEAYVAERVRIRRARIEKVRTVPADVVGQGTKAIRAYIAKRVHKRKERAERVLAMRTKDYIRAKEK